MGTKFIIFQAQNRCCVEGGFPGPQTGVMIHFKVYTTRLHCKWFLNSGILLDP